LGQKTEKTKKELINKEGQGDPDPLINFASPGTADFSCDGNVDADDVTMFLEDFGRSQYNNPCPACVAGDWCVY
jgi:hypothetical protein